MLHDVRVMRAALVAVVVTGCVSLPVEQRTTQGPTAEQTWVARMTAQNGRVPNFDERGQWRDALDRRISTYLSLHPEVANAPDVQVFRFSKQVAVGMTKEQVTILLGAPQQTVTDSGEMEKLARKYWADIKGKASEVWLYPGGWRLFFADERVIDITQYVPPGIGVG
jgi:hypothetical protein